MRAVTPLRVLSALVFMAATVLLRPMAAAALEVLAPRLVVQGPAPLPKARFAWSPDGRLLLIVSPATLAAQLWDGTTGDLIDNIALPIGDSSADRDYAAGGLAFDRGGTTATVRLSLGLIGGCTMFRVDAARLTATALPKPDGYCFSHADGRLPVSSRGAAIVETDDGTMLRYPGRAPVKLGNATPRVFTEVVLSPDASDVALLRSGSPPTLLGNAPLAGDTYLEIWNLAGGSLTRRSHLTGAYAEVRWLADGRVAVIADTGPAHGSDVAIPPTFIVDVATGRVATRLAGRCFVTPYGNRGDFLGGKPLGCVAMGSTASVVPPGLWLAGRDGRWRLHPDPRLQRLQIERIAAAPNGRTAIIVTHDGRSGVAADDTKAAIGRAILVTGDLRAAAPPAMTVLPLRLGDAEWINTVQYSRDGATAYLGIGNRVVTVDVATGRVEPLNLSPALAEVFVTGWDLTTALASGIGELAVGTPDDLRTLRLSEVPGFLAAGVAPDGRLAWTTASDGTVRLYRRADWSLALTLQYLGAAGYVAYNSLGQYDTPLGPDSNAFRWRVPDEPLRSLGGQTFMRDYYEPQLYTKILACAAADVCATALPPPPPVAGLNRTLPTVRIDRVRAGPSGDIAMVDVSAASGENRAAANGKTRSGLYNLRLFRGGKLVAQWPTPSAAAAVGLDGWRAANVVRPGLDGVFRHSFVVRLPTGLGARRAEFQAYAFNADRVKSGTARAAYDRPLVWPRSPKAYVLTIGIDDYADSILHLDFAAADADLMATRLGSVPGYRVHHLDLRGKGAKRQATRAAIADAIALLTPGDHAAARTRLGALGVDSSAFAAATPDDLVLITFAGHGWADPRGNFHLVPSDERTLPAQDVPDASSLIPAALLSDWLRGVDAGQAAIIIDACNSAAVVATRGFKPGPLGDRGLGQLAYDKGILILAASQTNQSAHEDVSLGHGFLTAALARDGLDGRGFGRADLNDDGAITLDEWLRYAVARLPSISATVAAAGRGRDFVLVPDAPDITAEPRAPPQQPSLFDFAGGPSPVVLAREPAWSQLQRLAASVGDGARSIFVGARRQQLWAANTLEGVIVIVLAITTLVIIVVLYGLFRLIRYVVRRPAQARA